ncbi:MAG: hypothetical protein GY796_24170 [Chloroflexi bacterium]|nr:hypothetical protein [Chloroflexota bacterium]
MPEGKDPSLKTIKNQTDKRIGIPVTKGKEEAEHSSQYLFILPPFGERTFDEKETPVDYKPWKEQNIVTVQDVKEVTQDENAYLSLGCLVWVFLLGIPLGLFVPALKTPWYWGVFTLVVVLILLYPVVIGRGRMIKLWLMQMFHLVVILAIGIGLPAIIIYFFGGGRDLLTMDSAGQPSLRLLGRGMQLTFITITSLFPALLYFLFDRQKLKTLRNGFFRTVIQLDPTILTLNDAESVYGERVEEIYGVEESARGKGRYLYGSRAPVFLTTLVMVVGWILVLLPIGPLPANFQSDDLLSLFKPRPMAINFGFLGSYFFALGMILRRYVRADLKPKAYSHITVRILTVIVLVWTLSLAPDVWNDVTDGVSNLVSQPAETTPEETDETQTEEAQSAEDKHPFMFMLAFFIGIVPETGTALLQDYLRGRKRISSRIPSLQEKLPLSHLEGINLYERARLLEEGIENIENLAHHDLIDLMLQTRIPVSRLIDWVDQGVLYLHLVDIILTVDEDEEQPTGIKKALHKLRRYGIRTATDLEGACKAAKKRKELGILLGILDEPGDQVKRLQVILDTLSDDEWMAYIREWRDPSRYQDTVYVLNAEHGFGLAEHGKP